MRDLKSPSFIMSHDVVNSPSHYAEGREFETIDVIEDWGLGYHLGNAVKYISRAGRKDDILQDLKKAQWYLNREIENLELERAEAEGILYEYEVQEEFPVDYQDILEDQAWEDAWAAVEEARQAEQRLKDERIRALQNEVRAKTPPIYNPAQDLGTVDLYVTPEELDRITHGQSEDPCGWDPNGGPTC